jgi:DNA replication and repair protein RecF
LKIQNINLTNFRNWPQMSLDFDNRVLIYGKNAQGKTNILEAAYILATTRSFRGRDAEIISTGADFMRVWGKIDSSSDKEVEAIIKRNGLGIEKEFRINAKKRPSIDFVGEFSAIVFSPEDINLISGTPEAKRRYLSFTIGQKDRGYLFNLLNYKKVLRQRNELLKRADLGRIKDEIDIWDANLSENGQRVIEARHRLSEFITSHINQHYQKLTGELRNFEFKYQPELWGDNLVESLNNSRSRDIAERTTTVGPHRDNWEIEENGISVSQTASRGELRTLVLALKLTERDWFLAEGGASPVVLLDDVFSELDSERRKLLVDSFEGSQLLITTTDLDHLDSSFHDTTQLIDIEALVQKKFGELDLEFAENSSSEEN